MQFGHYADEAETYRAFVRCRTSSPRPGRWSICRSKKHKGSFSYSL